MSTKPEPRNSGAGMREVHRIQDARLAKWAANTLPIELPPSLQAAKDAAKPTCGDCKRKVVDLLTYLELCVLPKMKGNDEKGLRTMIWEVHEAIKSERKDTK